jgi:hypothetical protein
LFHADIFRRGCNAHWFLTSTLDGEESLSSRPSTLPPVPIFTDSVWFPEPVLTLWSREKYLVPTGNRSVAVHPFATPTDLTWHLKEGRSDNLTGFMPGLTAPPEGIFCLDFLTSIKVFRYSEFCRHEVLSKERHQQSYCRGVIPPPPISKSVLSIKFTFLYGL